MCLRNRNSICQVLHVGFLQTVRYPLRIQCICTVTVVINRSRSFSKPDRKQIETISLRLDDIPYSLLLALTFQTVDLGIILINHFACLTLGLNKGAAPVVENLVKFTTFTTECFRFKNCIFPH